tara:strand:+ start:614 stop:886 length:273 start_codon:yes stop_codon:yes gene_type:complete
VAALWFLSKITCYQLGGFSLTIGTCVAEQSRHIRTLNMRAFACDMNDVHSDDIECALTSDAYQRMVYPYSSAHLDGLATQPVLMRLAKVK